MRIGKNKGIPHLFLFLFLFSIFSFNVRSVTFDFDTGINTSLLNTLNTPQFIELPFEDDIYFFDYDYGVFRGLSSYIQDTSGTQDTQEVGYWGIFKANDVLGGSISRKPIFAQALNKLDTGSTTTNITYRMYLKNNYYFENGSAIIFFHTGNDGVCSDNMFIRQLTSDQIQLNSCRIDVTPINNNTLHCGMVNSGYYNIIELTHQLCSSSANGEWKIVNITFENSQIDNRVNNLPDGFISYDPYICYNKSIGLGVVELNYNITDPENDDIRFSYWNTNLEKKQIVNDLNFKNNDGTLNYDIIDSQEFFYVNKSDMPKNEIENYWSIIGNDLYSTIGGYTNQRYFHQSAVRIPYKSNLIGYNMKKEQIEDFSYRTYLDLKKDTKISILLMNSEFDLIKNYTFERDSNDNVTIMIDDEFQNYNEDWYDDETYDDDTLQILFLMNNSQDKLRFSFNLGGPGAIDFVNETLNITDNIQYFIYDVYEKGIAYWYQSIVEVYDYVNIPSFSNNRNDTIYFDSSGTKYLNIYYNDIYHLNEWNEQNLIVYIDAKYCIAEDPEINDLQYGENFDENIITRVTRGFFSKFLNDVGAQQYIYNIYWMLYFIMLIVGYFIFKNMSTSIKITSISMSIYAFLGMGTIWQLLITGMIFLFSISKEISEVIT